MEKVEQDDGVRRAIAAMKSGDVDAAVKFTIANENRMTGEDFEVLAEKAGDDFIAALNEAIEGKEASDAQES